MIEEFDGSAEDEGERLDWAISEEDGAGAIEEKAPEVGALQLARSKAKDKGKKRFIGKEIIAHGRELSYGFLSCSFVGRRTTIKKWHRYGDAKSKNGWGFT